MRPPICPDRLDLAVQIGTALLQSQGTWPQTEADRDLWAMTSVQLADALLRELGETDDAPAVAAGLTPLACNHPLIADGRCIKCQQEV